MGKLALWDWDIQTDEVQWSDEHFRMEGYAVGEVTPSYEAWAARLHPDDREDTEAALKQAMDARDEYVREFRTIHPDGSVHWLYGRGRFFFDDEGTPVRMIGAMIDVTERRNWEERLRVMVAELQHRTRNLIGVVRSIAQQTMASTGPGEAFREELSHRLEALSRVQGLLSRSEEEPITIESMVRMELDALGAKDASARIRIAGPEVAIRPSIVQTLALAIHELATNARKYGALSNDSGVLDINWQTHEGSRGPRLALEWLETGRLPPDRSDAARRGYGSELIEKALPYSLNAKTSLKHEEAGLRCRIDIPLERTSSRRHPS